MKVTKLRGFFENWNKVNTKEEKPIPIGFYLCITNIICLITANYYIFF